VGEHEVLMRPVDTVFGCLKQAGNGITASVEEMDEAIGERMRRSHQ